MALKMIGKVFSIGVTQSIPSKNGNTFNKRELVLDATRYDGLTGEKGVENYPMFEFGGERCAELDKFKVGDIVEVSFDLQGSFYTKDGVEKNMTRVRGYRIEHFQTRQKTSPTGTSSTHAQPAQPPMPSDFPPPPESQLPW